MIILFQNIIFPPKNKKDDNIKMLIEAFDEFKKQNIIIETADYYSRREAFDVRFIPLNDIEIEDLFITITKTMKRLKNQVR